MTVETRQDRSPLRAQPLRRAAGMRHAGLVFIGNVVARGLGFLFPLLLVHAISKPDFATVSFFIGTGFFAASIILNSVPSALTRHMAADVDGKHPWFSSAVVAGIPIFLVAAGVGEALAAAAGVPAGLMTVMVSGLCIDSYIWALLRGEGQFKLLVGYRTAANVLQLALLALVIVGGTGSVTIAVIIYAYVYILPIAVLELWQRPLRNALAGRGQPSRRCVRELVTFAAPTLVAGVGYAVFIHADVLWVKLFAPASLGDYAIAKTLSQPVTMVSFAVVVVLMPRVARVPPDRRLAMLKTALVVTVVSGAAMLAGYLALGGLLVQTLLPGSYAPAVRVLPVLVAALTVLSAYSVLGEWWVGTGRPIPSAVTIVLGALTAIGMQMVLTPAHGGRGAALALLAGATVAITTLGLYTLHTCVWARRPATRQ